MQKKFMRGFQGGGKEEFDICLKGKFDYKDLSLEEIEQRLKKILNEKQNEDIIQRITKTGPHRDDLQILINGNSARLYAAKGSKEAACLRLSLRRQAF